LKAALPTGCSDPPLRPSQALVSLPPGLDPDQQVAPPEKEAR